MEASECIKTRRSIRDFLDNEIPDNILREIVEVASYAPSWKNKQSCRYVIIKKRELLKNIADTATCGFIWNKNIIYRASALVAVVYTTHISGCDPDGQYSTPKGDRWEMFDAGIASQTFCLAAWDKGVGSVIMGIFEDYVVSKALNLQYNERVGALIAIGYPYEKPEVPPRQSPESLMQIIK